jgi:hypothetical protein
MDVASAAGTAEKVIEGVMKVEPIIVGATGMFVPGAAPIIAMVQPWVITAVPFIERALKAIEAGNGGDSFSAFVELLQHVSKGLPNSPILSPSSSQDPSAQGSG